MPEEKVEYVTSDDCVASTLEIGKDHPEYQGKEPELVCPLKVHAAVASCRVIDTACLKERCAWWMKSLQMCSIQAIPDSIMGLMEFAEEQS